MISVIKWQRAPWEQDDAEGCTALLAHALVWGLVFAADALTTWHGIGIMDAAIRLRRNRP